MTTWWLSFSDNAGKNLGVIITDAETKEEVLAKVSAPESYADVTMFECHSEELISEASKFPRDTLITPEEMLLRGYTTNWVAR